MYVINLCGPVTPQQVLWQTVKTQMKWRIVCDISSGSALFATFKTKTMFRERNIICLKSVTCDPKYIQWTIRTLMKNGLRENMRITYKKVILLI